MRRNRKKGFTLIELMIVLAIIAILAIVLIPKAGIMKSQAKNQGVLTNERVVIAYLQSRIDNDTANNLGSVGGRTTARSQITAYFNSFVGTSNATANPFNTAGTGIDNSTAEGSSVAGVATPSNDAMIIGSITGNAPAAASYSAAALQGNVIVIACANGYEVYGIDNGGNVLNYTVVQ